MVLIFYLVVNAGLVLSFWKLQRKRLHVLEQFLYGCLSSLVVQNYSAIQSMNYKSSIVPDVLSLEMAHLLNRTVLYPVITLLFLNRYAAGKSTGTKLVLLIGYTSWFTGMEWLSNRLGVFIHVYWKVAWSAAFWLLYLLLFMGIMKGFRKWLDAEGVGRYGL